MNEQECAEAVADWIAGELPALKIVRPFIVAQKTELPDAMVDVVEKSVEQESEEFPFSQLQQVMLRVFRVETYFMVESAGNPAADEAETAELRGYGATLESSLLEDATLGGRVELASPIMSFDYDQPFIQYADGTRGRQMIFRGAVGEIVQGQA